MNSPAARTWHSGPLSESSGKNTRRCRARSPGTGSLLQESTVGRHIIPEGRAHLNSPLQGSQIEAAAVAVRAPVFDVIGIVMGLLEDSLPRGSQVRMP